MAKRAGVGKPTIYRRLRDDGLPDLIALALPVAQADLFPPRARQSRDVATLCAVVAQRLTSPVQRQVLAQLGGDPARLARYLQPVADALRTGLGRGVDTDATVQVLLVTVVGSALLAADSSAAHDSAKDLAAAYLARNRG
ncbi:hypothetical protein BOO71_0000925 [Deinococcus marmoris]|uniref:Uncharacterized protein n=1 Tax=Deinococcus marmoris TaxID=249408 RepID=A0A1U7P4E3_9DEIO|nr:hypothetical protein BOO71_0000925 [Deinococcus marmoris]